MKDFKKSYNPGGKFGGRPSFGARPGFGGHGSDRPAESFDATCSGCNARCEVPFRPNGKKPVYCRNCFKQNVPTTSFTGQPFTRPTEYKEDGSATDLKKQFAILNTKLDRLISAIEAQTRALGATE